MHHAALVRIGERAGDVAQDAHRFRDRQRPPAQPYPEALALDVGHDVVRQAFEIAGGEHRHDVGLLERRGDPDLALEAGGGHRRGELRRKELHDDLPPQALLVGDEHARHAAAAELALDGVTAGKRLLDACLEIRHVCRCLWVGTAGIYDRTQQMAMTGGR